MLREHTAARFVSGPCARALANAALRTNFANVGAHRWRELPVSPQACDSDLVPGSMLQPYFVLLKDLDSALRGKISELAEGGESKHCRQHHPQQADDQESKEPGVCAAPKCGRDQGC